MPACGNLDPQWSNFYFFIGIGICLILFFVFGLIWFWLWAVSAVLLLSSMFGEWK
jgi:hypothetical protein